MPTKRNGSVCMFPILAPGLDARFRGHDGLDESRTECRVSSFLRKRESSKRQLSSALAL